MRYEKKGEKTSNEGNVQVTLKVNQDDAIKLLDKLEKGLSNFQKPFDRTIIYMQRSFADSFKEGGREQPWVPNAEATTIIKRGSNPLLNNGLLRMSLTGMATDSYIKESATKLEFGTTVPYAKIQNEGGEIPVTMAMRKYMVYQFGIVLGSVVKIPARKFMFFTKDDIVQITKIFQGWMDEEVAAIV